MARAGIATKPINKGYDANAHYGAMHGILDLNLAPEIAVQHAHMTLEYALKAQRKPASGDQ